MVILVLVLFIIHHSPPPCCLLPTAFRLLLPLALASCLTLALTLTLTPPSPALVPFLIRSPDFVPAVLLVLTPLSPPDVFRRRYPRCPTILSRRPPWTWPQAGSRRSSNPFSAPESEAPRKIEWSL